MNIIEIQESIHGEQPYQGSPCLIVRFKECNLTCPYCDTKKKMQEVGVDYNLYDLLKEIKSHKLSVMLTGGEPLLDPHCESLIYQLNREGIFTVIETNGTLPLVHRELPNVRYVADIKLHLELEMLLKALKNCANAHYIKFVYWDNDSFEKAVTLTRSGMLHPKRFIFSPVITRKPSGYSIGNYTSHIDTLIQLRKQGHMVMFQVQLHKLIGVP